MVNVDYSVYLVTDSGLVPQGLTLLDQVKRSIDNGATVVQLREKDIDTRGFIEKAEQIHELTQKAGIPLIINDRVDVALAIDAEGIHVGQDDMPASLVRKLIGPDKILGVSVNTIEEAQAVVDGGVTDYIGVGAVFSTNTKDLKSLPIGSSGVREILKVLADTDIKSVVIGGVNSKNVQRVLYTSGIPGKPVDGVAVVSDIIAAKDAGLATRTLRDLIKTPVSSKLSSHDTLKPIASFVENVTTIKPMTHQITNGVVKNFSANITLSIGASPVMSEEPRDFDEFAQFPNSALLINAGTTHDSDIYFKAVQAYNVTGNPVVFDPVGAGASTFRRALTRQIINSGYFTIIKGNQGEIFTAAGVHREMKGVDSVGEESIEDVVEVAKRLALDTRSIVVVTGATDIIAEGVLNGQYHLEKDVKQRVVLISGGHPLMGSITGSGCSLGSVLASYAGANPDDPFLAAITAVSLYKHAGGIAGKDAESDGPGTFSVKFLDELNKASINPNPEKWNIQIKEYD